jgi:hypothetical protein
VTSCLGLVAVGLTESSFRGVEDGWRSWVPTRAPLSVTGRHLDSGQGEEGSPRIPRPFAGTSAKHLKVSAPSGLLPERRVRELRADEQAGLALEVGDDGDGF